MGQQAYMETVLLPCGPSSQDPGRLWQGCEPGDSRLWHLPLAQMKTDCMVLQSCAGADGWYDTLGRETLKEMEDSRVGSLSLVRKGLPALLYLQTLLPPR